jgi:hypothetical protein
MKTLMILAALTLSAALVGCRASGEVGTETTVSLPR